MLSHTHTFTHKGFHAAAFAYRHFLHTGRFDTQTLWHTDTFTHGHFKHTEDFLHTEAFTHRRFYTQAHKEEDTYTYNHVHTHRHRHTRTQRDRHSHTDTHTQRSHRCRGHLSNHCMGWLVFIHCINSAEASETQLRWTAVTSNNVGAAAESSCLKSGLTNRRMSEKWAPIKQQTQELMWEMLLYVLLPTNASRMKNEINSWLQAQKQSAALFTGGEFKKVECRWQSLRQFCLTYADALWWDRNITRIKKSSDSLCLTYADALHFDIEKTRYQGSQRTSKWELGCATLENPGTTQSAVCFHHPQRI